MEDLALFSFQIITFAGEAKASFMSAIRSARNGELDKARDEYERGTLQLIDGHKVHAKLLQHEAMGIDVKVSLLLVHAEDQLMNTETCKSNAEEFIYLYGRMVKAE